jgi:ribosomal protein S18 acetylase RimI-like enzyme
MKAARILPLQADWIAGVAQIHMDALPNDFLPGLGFDFLNDVFYPAALKSEHARIYTAVMDDQPLGFVIVTRNSSQFFRSIVSAQMWDFLKTGIRSSFSSLDQFKKNIEIVLSSLKEGVHEDYGEIYEIAVRPDSQGQGIGRKLVQASMDYLKENDLPGIKIKTRKDNTAWVQFFLGQGWQLAQEIELVDNRYVILSYTFE